MPLPDAAAPAEAAADGAFADNPRGAFADNLLGFTRFLRRAGLPVGPAESLAAAAALRLTGVADRDTTRDALRATLLHAREGQDIFDGAFDLWWRPPAPPGGEAPAPGETAPRQPGARRLAEALLANQPSASDPQGERQRSDTAVSVSAAERLGAMDFESMGAEEIRDARREIRRLSLPLAARPTRRFRPAPHGPRFDLPATVRESLRQGGELATIQRSARVEKPPPLVVICDISGSMARYAQVLVHFLHAVTQDRERVHTFLFGTRLTNVTRQLRQRDPDVAFDLVGRAVPDWSGGTRIGDAIAEFNRLWARRVLTQGAVVLLITDGLDRSGGAGLAEAAERLARSCRRLIWLNPLLRYSGFQPKSGGVRALLPHVHEHRPVHNLNSLRALIETLSDARGAGKTR
ncbi:vWA domain-containing protein [Roseomonas elaeocarpi]|uniref:VWA domain-containing protein n=1 Tax=Roseomonas elaeocarpi TaxID=907779 RepID=A0ABV6K154_9PROT